MEQQPQMPLDMSKATEVICNECNSTDFIQVYQMKRLSAFVSPTGAEALIPIQLFGCKSCGHINEEFLPKENG